MLAQSVFRQVYKKNGVRIRTNVGCGWRVGVRALAHIRTLSEAVIDGVGVDDHAGDAAVLRVLDLEPAEALWGK